MRIDWHWPSHGFNNFHLPERIIEMVITTDHMGHPHIMVINHHGQHIGWRAITAQHHQIIQRAMLDGHRALDGVIDGGAAIQRHFQPHCKGQIRGISRVGITPWADDLLPCLPGFTAHGG